MSSDQLLAKGHMSGTHRLVAPEATVARVRPLLEQMGITRVANITGLDRIGLPVVAVYRPNARSLSVSQGKGVTLAAARASGMMEAIELFHAEHIQLPLLLGSYSELVEQHPLLNPLELPLARNSRFAVDLPICWIEGRCLFSGDSFWLPFELVHTNACLPEPPGSGCFSATSNGLASGNHHLEAISHGLCELIERDAVTLWHLKGEQARRETRIDPYSVRDPLVQALLAQIERAELNTLIWEATSDVAIPTFVCTIFERSSAADLALYSGSGAGCHPDKRVALTRAITEAAQSRLTLIAGSRDDLERHMYHANLESEQMVAWMHEELQQPAHRSFEAIVDQRSSSLTEDLAWELAQLAAAGFTQALVVDLTRPELNIPVVRIVVPGLEGCDEVADYMPGARALAVMEATP